MMARQPGEALLLRETIDGRAILFHIAPDLILFLIDVMLRRGGVGDRLQPLKCLSTGVLLVTNGYRCKSSIQRTNSGISTGTISRLTTSPCCPLRASTQCSCKSALALISWWGT